MEDEIKGKTRGDFQSLLIALLEANREQGCDDDQAKQDAVDLYNAGEA